MMYDQYGNHGADGFGWLFMFIMMALLFLGVVAVVRYITHNGGTATSQGTRHSSASSANSAVTILEERYAKGDIDKLEFDEKRKDLGS